MKQQEMAFFAFLATYGLIICTWVCLATNSSSAIYSLYVVYVGFISMLAKATFTKNQR